MIEKKILTEAGIDHASLLVTEFLKDNKVEKHLAVKIRLALEGILMKYIRELDTDTEFSLELKKRFPKISIQLNVPGISVDPLADLEEDIVTGRLIEAMPFSPSWDYSAGENVVSFSFTKKLKSLDFALILGALILGILLGLASKGMPEATLDILCNSYLQPIANAIMGFMRTLSILLIFFSVVTGVCSMGDIETLKNTGSKMLSRFAGSIALCVLLAIGTSIAIVDVKSNGGSGFNGAALWQMLLGIVPSNILESFISGNALQVIFLAILSGIVLLRLGGKAKMLMDWNSMVNIFIQDMLQLVVKLMPLIVFITLYTQVASGNFSDASGILKYVILVVTCCIVIFVVAILRVAIKMHISFTMVLKKMLPPLIIGASTASSTAAFPETLDVCENKLGIDKQLVSMGVPLAQTLFKPSLVIPLTCGCLCMADLYGCPLAPSDIITLGVTIFILVIAEPPIPNIMISAFTLLFSQFGIPAAAISIVLALDPFVDRISTATNMTGQMAELVLLSNSLGNLDKEKLHSKN